MMKIKRETDYAIALLGLMAQEPSHRFNAAAIAARRGLPQPVVSKVLKLLAHSGILRSVRGVKGGYGLARPPHAITVAEVIDAVEGPIQLTECAEVGSEACRYGDHCNVSDSWAWINRAVKRALDEITLADMSAPEPCGTNSGEARATRPLEFTGVRYVGDH